ncbi:hypothetical protein ACN4EE_10440 [Geminocystis sp. CENA526]|uniref:type II toxin-antitoxin system RelN family antitoxin n=1 Tax=Geminocystis sp. CENA526 TaxID=1355871 RepID=UPI003D6F6094
MKAIETIGIIDHNGQIILPEPLNVVSESPIKLIILLDDTTDLSSETHLKSAVESFTQGWQEAMTGKTHPLDELWIGIENE